MAWGNWAGSDDWYQKMLASGQYWNDWDLDYASRDQNFANEIFKAKEGYAKAKSEYDAAQNDQARALAQASMTGWNNYAEDQRKRYNYSSGGAGAEYNPYSAGTLSPTTNAGMYGEAMSAAFSDYRNAPGFSYDPYTPGVWDGHSDFYNQTRDALQNHGPFEYDYTKDPLYDVYKKEYTREGQRASADALAQAAAMTGGVPSSYANMVGQQAGNYYASQLADKIPELRQQAYNEYNQDFSNLLAKYNAAAQGDQFDYGVWSDAENRNRQAWADNLGLAQYGYETGMNQRMNTLDMAMQLQALDQANAENDRNNARGQVDAMLAAGQTPTDEMVAAAGYSPEYVAAMLQAYAEKNAPRYGGVGGVVPLTDPNATGSNSMLSQEQWDNLFQSVHLDDPNKTRAAARAALNQYAPYLNNYQKTTLAHLAGIDAEALAAAGGVDALGIDTITDLTNMLYPYEEQQTPNMQFGSGVHAKQFNDVMGQIQRDINSKNYTDAEYRLNQLLSNPSLSEAQYNQIMQYFENNKDIGVK